MPTLARRDSPWALDRRAAVPAWRAVIGGTRYRVEPLVGTRSLYEALYLDGQGRWVSIATSRDIEALKLLCEDRKQGVC